MNHIEKKNTDFKAGQILVFDKPLHWTSFQLVGKVRWMLCRAIGEKKLKVGHAGTLDPLATGVMVVCTGKATKRIEELQKGEKEYIATLQLGATTPSYDLARKGKDVELKAKRITVHELELLDFNPTTMSLQLRIRCSKGTYIRSLARDIGHALQSGAHLTALRRTKVGDFNVENAFPDIETFGKWLDAHTGKTEDNLLSNPTEDHIQEEKP